MKKVLFVATTAKKHINLFHIPVIEALTKKGVQVDVATNGDEKVPFVKNQFTIAFERNPLAKKNINAYKQLKSIILENDYDIISCHTPVGGAIARLAARKSNAKVMYTAHGFHFFEGGAILKNIIFKSIESFLAHFTDCLITINSEDYYNAQTFKLKKGGKVYFVNGVGIDTEKIINSKVDVLEKKKELGISEDKKIIVMTGEFIKRKNHKTALKSFAMAENENLVMVLCGQGKLEEDIKKYAKELGIYEKVYFLGFRRDAKEIAKISDIFIFTSFQEGLPASVIEAMAAGIPVIASDIRGNHDLINDSLGGFLFSPNDTKGFADAINLLSKSPKLCEKMGDYNKKKSNNYDLKQILSETVNIYEHLLKTEE